jgi:hypothetical protein
MARNNENDPILLTNNIKHCPMKEVRVLSLRAEAA